MLLSQQEERYHLESKTIHGLEAQIRDLNQKISQVNGWWSKLHMNGEITFFFSFAIFPREFLEKGKGHICSSQPVI
jgi:TolA-binding protein